MPLNSTYDEQTVIQAIASALETFYGTLIEKIDGLNIQQIIKRKNPYLYRAKAMQNASEIVESILTAFVSSSEETIFGNCFAGKRFWAELTGDEQFYIKIIGYMGTMPEKYVADYKESYDKAANRLIREFSNSFCREDGSIDWEKLVEFNSGD